VSFGRLLFEFAVELELPGGQSLAVEASQQFQVAARLQERGSLLVDFALGLRALAGDQRALVFRVSPEIVESVQFLGCDRSRLEHGSVGRRLLCVQRCAPGVEDPQLRV